MIDISITDRHSISATLKASSSSESLEGCLKRYTGRGTPKQKRERERENSNEEALALFDDRGEECIMFLGV